MTAHSSEPTLLERALSEGDRVDATVLFERSGSVVPWEGRFAPREATPHPWFLAARSAPNNNSLNWLKEHAPTVVPQGEMAFHELELAVRGQLRLPDPLRVADWLVANTNVLMQLTPESHRRLMRNATRPEGIQAIDWVLNPNNGLPPWHDDATEPLLTWLIQNERRYPRELLETWPDLTQQILHLLDVGVKPTASAPTNHYPLGSSPLHQLILGFEDHLSQSNEAHVPIDERWNTAVFDLWPRLLMAGDDHHRLLRPGGDTILERVSKASGLWGHLEGVTLAVDRARQTAQAPTPEQGRRRPRARS